MMANPLWAIEWAHGVALHGGGYIVVALIVGWLLVCEPLLGRVAYRRFMAALKRGEVGARVRFYRSWTWQAWLLALLVLSLVLGIVNWTPAQLGLRLPHFSVSVPREFLFGMMLSVAIGMVLGIVMSRRKRSSSSDPVRKDKRNPEVMYMLPRNAGERRAFAALSITAGITEEIVWRGFGLALLVAMFPHAPVPVVVAVLAVVFGWAHLYQGPIGMFATGMLGAVLTVLYVATGSLLFPIVLHVLIDLAAMLRVVPEIPEAQL